MGLGRGSSAFVLAAIVAANSAAAAPRCASSDEVTAIQAAAIQQQLMVAALTCNQVDRFNAFQVAYGQELRRSDAALEHMFRRLFGGGRGDAQYHAFKTRLANDSSIRSIHDNPSYCHDAGIVFEAALTPDKPSLAGFVSGIDVVEQGPVDSCTVSVTLGLGAAVPSVVPKPNPTRVASEQTAPGSTTPQQQAAAPTNPPAPANN